MTDYTVVVHKAQEGGYWVEVPALPGCFSQGETVEEAMDNVQEAIESHLVALRAEGDAPGPDDVFMVGRVPVASVT